MDAEGGLAVRVALCAGHNARRAALGISPKMSERHAGNEREGPGRGSGGLRLYQESLSRSLSSLPGKDGEGRGPWSCDAKNDRRAKIEKAKLGD
ncbi:unnamed protein product [Lampetra planeri]